MTRPTTGRHAPARASEAEGLRRRPPCGGGASAWSGRRGRSPSAPFARAWGQAAQGSPLPRRSRARYRDLMLRIGFFGGGDQAMAALDALAAQKPYKLAFIRPRFKTDPIAKFGVPILDTENINSPESVAFVRTHKPDLIVSLNERSILGRELRSIARLGSINLHNGLLPLQGGGGGAYSGIVNGEPVGMTIHYMDDGVDTGDIIAQRSFLISDTATMRDCQKLFLDATPTFLLDAIRQIETGNVRRTPQSKRPFHYTPAKPDWDELIDWAEPAKRICDKVRARTPGPTPFYLCDDRKHFVLAVELEPLLVPNPVAPGQVIRRDKERGVLVKAGDSGLWIRQIRINDTETVPSHRVGTMLRYNVTKELYDLRAAVSQLRQRLGN